MINADWLNNIDYHIETIECPECHSKEQVKIHHTELFWMYAHICNKCKYAITESEWNKVCL